MILLIDSDVGFRSNLAASLSKDGLACLGVAALGEAVQVLRDAPEVRVIVSEIVLPDREGFDLLRHIADGSRGQPVIFVTGHGSVERAKQAIRLGAFEYFEKPVELALLVRTIRRALEDSEKSPGPGPRPAGPGTGEVLEARSRDDLTGLASHHYMLEKLPEIRREARKLGRPLSLCMLDIDGFRNLIGHHGLTRCDMILTEAAHRLRRMVRVGDIVGRYGGDEFLIALSGADEEDACALARRIVENLRAHPLDVDGTPIQLPLCAGVAEIDHHDSASDLEFIDRAIEAVYHAKLIGPEAVVAWTPQLVHETGPLRSIEELVTLENETDSVNFMMWRFRELNRQLANVSLESLRVLVAAVEARDPYTRDHSVRVAAFARHLAEEVKLTKRQVQVIHSAAMLHDIGKIGVPDSILIKPAKLTEEEFEHIKRHPVIGVNILEQTRFFVTELPLVRHHHERYDGRGYPDGILGSDIPLGSRIIHVADAVEAMLAQRSYKRPCTVEHVLAELENGRGLQFDPEVAVLARDLISRGVLDRIWRIPSASARRRTVAVPDLPALATGGSDAQ